MSKVYEYSLFYIDIRLSSYVLIMSLFLMHAVWDLENGLNIHKQGDMSTNNIPANSGSFRSENSETLSATSHSSSEGPISSNNEIRWV